MGMLEKVGHVAVIYSSYTDTGEVVRLKKIYENINSFKDKFPSEDSLQEEGKRIGNNIKKPINSIKVMKCNVVEHGERIYSCLYDDGYYEEWKENILY